ncbi:MAG: laccase domain-containing protein [Burkholderiales bacterium]|nr:laccase domain-containing protein [Burkholderiales bacterium]
MHPDWLVPADLPAGVGAVFTTRAGGVSAAPWSGLNLGDHVGDDPAAVADNRRRLAAALGARPVFLRQVHGCEVVRLDAASADAPVCSADACWTTEPGVACCILVADCLPVLFAAPNGRGVAAAHAGWRGLAAGVLQATARALADGVGCGTNELRAWLGPCIAQADFEVGADVLQAFGVRADEVAARAAAARPQRVDEQAGKKAGEQAADRAAHPGAAARLPSGGDAWGPARHFTPGRAGRPGRWQADLAGLALDRLAALGIAASGQTLRTDDARLYSYRRQGACGRFAGCIWLR